MAGQGGGGSSQAIETNDEAEQSIFFVQNGKTFVHGKYCKLFGDFSMKIVGEVHPRTEWRGGLGMWLVSCTGYRFSEQVTKQIPLASSVFDSRQKFLDAIRIAFPSGTLSTGRCRQLQNGFEVQIDNGVVLQEEERRYFELVPSTFHSNAVAFKMATAFTITRLIRNATAREVWGCLYCLDNKIYPTVGGSGRICSANHHSHCQRNAKSAAPMGQGVALTILMYGLTLQWLNPNVTARNDRDVLEPAIAIRLTVLDSLHEIERPEVKRLVGDKGYNNQVATFAKTAEATLSDLKAKIKKKILWDQGKRSRY
ncbi:hypothetical protein OS493_000342 [Desmophyllum pertusum]|uniref:Uncharacterized protein n=1 Tax=Desmophyllum pertusum TaxID=174260 RepID=A0A9X0DBK3_9CNID|nr:hypothetical protein OS493_000342 [Desmophyllum pertusum]